MFETRTKRLYLRDFQNDDISAYQQLGSAPEAIHHYPQDALEWQSHVVSLAKRFATWQLGEPRRNFALAMFFQQTFIGVVSIRTESAHNRQGSVGCGLVHEFWSKGFASEAMKAVIDLGFYQLEMHRISAETVSGNLVAIAMLKRLGMRLEGVLRENQYIKGSWRDTLIFGLLEDEWIGNPAAKAG